MTLRLQSAVRALRHDEQDQQGRNGRKPGQNGEQAAPADGLDDSSAGAVAVTAPSAPSMMNQPLASAMRSGGNHSTMALRPAISADGDAEADQRAAEHEADEPSASANTSAPAAASKQQGALDAARPVAVEQHAEGELHGGEDEEVDRRQQPEVGRAEAELGGRGRRRSGR